MDIIFKTMKMEKIFNSSRDIDRKYGKGMAEKIRRRMATLRAAENLERVPHQKPERRHMLTGDKEGQFAVDLEHPYRLVFAPNHVPVPKKEDGGFDLSKITSIKILNVEDYH